MQKIIIIFILITTHTLYANTFKAGSYIVDMGVVPQTQANGLKPYGLLYDLIRNHAIPVSWIINPSKSKDAVDFTYNAKNYSAGPFIIPAEYASEALSTINTWKAAGVIIDGPTNSSFEAPLYKEITSFPNAVIEIDNGDIIEKAFYLPADIPDTSYRVGTPNDVGVCDDLFALPHSDPEDWDVATQTNFKNYVSKGGSLWAGCRSVGAIENDSIGLGEYYLSDKGLYHDKEHDDQNSNVFTYTADIASDPIMQFMGRVDEALVGGAEEIYIPTKGWRSSTTVAVSDSTFSLPLGSTGPAAIVAYGQAKGDKNAGMIVYEASHSFDKGTEAQNVAAARIYGNFLLLSALDNALDVKSIDIADSVVSENNATFKVTSASASSFTWSSSCGGSFSPDANQATVIFTAPSVEETISCTIRVELRDACNRLNVESKVIEISSNLVAEYHFDECMWDGTANQVKDSSGNEYHGTSTGDANTSSKGTVARTALFDGTGDSVEVKDTPRLNPDHITVMAWLNPNAFEKWDAVAVKSSNDDWYDGWGLTHFTKTNDINFFINNCDKFAASTTIPFNVNSHVVGTYDGKEIKIYVNGVLKNTMAYTQAIKHSAKDLWLGHGTGKSDSYTWDGSIDEVKIYDKALSLTKIQEIYNNESAGKNRDGTNRDAIDCSNTLPFTCDSNSFINYVTSGSFATGEEHLANIDLSNGTLISDNKVTGVVGVTSLGYNVVDDHLWGYNMGANKIAKIDANYEATLYDVVGLDNEYYSGGDVSSSGVLHLSVHKSIFKDASNTLEIARFNLNSNPPTKLNPLSLSSSIDALDIAFNPIDKHLYFMQSDGRFYRINITNNGETGTIEYVGNTNLGSVYNVISYFDSSGNFYFNSNATDIYQIKFDNLGITSISPFSTLTTVLTQGDGARCANAELDKEVNATKCTFNIERTNSATDNINSDKRNAWYTQIVARDFHYSVVAYDLNNTTEVILQDVTFKVELYNNESKSIVSEMAPYYGHFSSFSPSQRITIFDPNDMLNLPALKDVEFIVSYALDSNGSLIKAPCPSGNYELCYNNSLVLNTLVSDNARDNFSIRPEKFNISIADNNQERINNNNSINNVSFAAGYDYNLSITAQNNQALPATGYNSSLKKSLQFNSAPSCDDTDDANTTITFTDGLYSDLAFTHANVGLYSLQLEDTQWTKVDSNKTVPDCQVDARYSSANFNALSGCTIGANDINISFHPYQFKIDFSMNNLPNSGHDDFIYMSDINKDDHNVSIQFIGTITAQNEDNSTTTNFTQGCVAKNVQLNINTTTLTDQGTVLQIQTSKHPSKGRVNVNISRMARFNNEPLSSITYDTIPNITSNPLNISKEKFIDKQNASVTLDLRYNIQKHLALTINPVEIIFESLILDSPLSASSAEGKVSPNYIPSGTQEINVSKNFYFARVASDLINYPILNTSSGSNFIRTPLNVEIFCDQNISYCAKTGLLSHTDQNALIHLSDGWYPSVDHNPTLDGNVSTLISSKVEVSVNPNANITFEQGRNGTILNTFNSCSNTPIVVSIMPDTALLYDTNEANNGNPFYVISCTDKKSSLLSGIGEAGNIIDNNASSYKTYRIDW